MKYAFYGALVWWLTFIWLAISGQWILGLIAAWLAVMVVWLWLHLLGMECEFAEYDEDGVFIGRQK